MQVGTAAGKVCPRGSGAQRFAPSVAARRSSPTGVPVRRRGCRLWEHDPEGLRAPSEEAPVSVPSTPDHDRRLTELRAGMSVLTSAAADLRVGAQPEVRVLPDGRLWLTELEVAVTAAHVYQAARGLVAAQLDAIAQVSGQPVEDHALAWLVTLQTNEVMVGLQAEAALAVEDDAA